MLPLWSFIACCRANCLLTFLKKGFTAWAMNCLSFTSDCHVLELLAKKLDRQKFVRQMPVKLTGGTWTQNVWCYWVEEKCVIFQCLRVYSLWGQCTEQMDMELDLSHEGKWHRLESVKERYVSGCRWESNSKVDLKVIRWEGMDLIMWVSVGTINRLLWKR